MKQQEIRELAFQFLYQIQIQREAVPDQLDSFLKREEERIGEGMTPTDSAKVRQLVEGVIKNQERIDEEIRNHLVGWTIERTAPVDLAILRLALYEIFEMDAPFSVVCHEAVLLANKFSIERSRKFINGLLAQYDPDRQGLKSAHESLTDLSTVPQEAEHEEAVDSSLESAGTALHPVGDSPCFAFGLEDSSLRGEEQAGSALPAKEGEETGI